MVAWIYNIYAALPGSDAEDTYDGTCTLLSNYFLPKRNKRYERHVFLTSIQRSTETISQYVTRLRNLAKTCVFADVTRVDQIIEKCTSSKLRKRLLREKDLTLDKTLEIAQIMESTGRQMEKYNNSD